MQTNGLRDTKSITEIEELKGATEHKDRHVDTIAGQLQNFVQEIGRNPTNHRVHLFDGPAFAAV